MDFEDWTVDMNSLTASHTCGFSLQIEGNPKDPSAVFPGKFPPGLTAIEQVRLVRTGVEAFAKLGKGVAEKPKATYKAPEGRPKRPLLSLKKDKPNPVS